LAVINFVATSNQWKSWYTARILCFNKSFKRNCTISTGIPNLWVWCKNDPRLWESDKTFRHRLWLLMLLGIQLQLHPKTSRLLVTPTLNPQPWLTVNAENTTYLLTLQMWNEFKIIF